MLDSVTLICSETNCVNDAEGSRSLGPTREMRRLDLEVDISSKELILL